MKIVNLGSLNLDNIYSVPHIICGGETLLAGGMTESIGGKGLNQSVAVARSGSQIYHAGMIGTGGGQLKAYLDSSGVDTSLIQSCGETQGHTVIQVDPSGQNSIIVCGGSNQKVDQKYVDQTFGHFQAGDYLMLQNEISNLDYILKSAGQRGLRIVLNASPINDDLLRLDFSSLDWLVINEIECAAISGCVNARDGYRTLRDRYPDIGILLTVGAEGSVSWKDGKEIVQAACPAEAIDTTGAGDTYVGYFIGCLAQGYSRRDSMRLASTAAAIAVSRRGAAPSIPTMDEVLARSRAL